MAKLKEKNKIIKLMCEGWGLAWMLEAKTHRERIWLQKDCEGIEVCGRTFNAMVAQKLVAPVPNTSKDSSPTKYVSAKAEGRRSDST